MGGGGKCCLHDTRRGGVGLRRWSVLPGIALFSQELAQELKVVTGPRVPLKAPPNSIPFTFLHPSGMGQKKCDGGATEKRAEYLPSFHLAFRLCRSHGVEIRVLIESGRERSTWLSCGSGRCRAWWLDRRSGRHRLSWYPWRWYWGLAILLWWQTRVTRWTLRCSR